MPEVAQSFTGLQESSFRRSCLRCARVRSQTMHTGMEPARLSARFVGCEHAPFHKASYHIYISLQTPMGELFDLEALATTCKELGRYSFFVTSSPLHIVNGVASPPKYVWCILTLDVRSDLRALQCDGHLLTSVWTSHLYFILTPPRYRNIFTCPSCSGPAKAVVV
jgi:hypothetical protein